MTKSATDFEAAITKAWSIGFDDLLSLRANCGVGRILTRSDDIGLVEIETERDPQRPVLARGQWFRLEFANDIDARECLAFQRTSGVTMRLPTSLAVNFSTVRVPASKPDGSPGYMRENNNLGQHDFVALLLTSPLPLKMDQLLDANHLIQSEAPNQLASHLKNLPTACWQLSRLTVTIDEREK